MTMTAVLCASSLAYAASLDVPSNGDTLSGIGIIHGWKCEAEGAITIRFDAGSSIPVTYGFPRGDTSRTCGGDDGNNGFYAFYNWAILGDGEHTAVAYDDGVEFARSTFTVTTTGEEFLKGAMASVTISNFPAPEATATFVWNESTQHLELTHVDRPASGAEPASCEGWGTSRWESDAFVYVTTEWVRQCLNAGADPNARGQYGETPLHRVAWASDDNAGAIRLLIAAGADVNARSNGGTTPLHLAASWPDNFAIVVVLLEAGANPNALNNDGHTPLYYHDNYGLNPEIERALINAGADPNIHPPGEPIDCSTPECVEALT